MLQMTGRLGRGHVPSTQAGDSNERELCALHIKFLQQLVSSARYCQLPIRFNPEVIGPYLPSGFNPNPLRESCDDLALEHLELHVNFDFHLRDCRTLPCQAA